MRLAEHAVAAGMMLGRLDRGRDAIVCTPGNMRGKVRPDELRVPASDLARSVGAAGAQLVAWLIRGRTAGVAWYKAPDQVRYLEGRPDDVLPESVRRVMHAEGWE